MKLKPLLIITPSLLLSVSIVMAEEYQSFSSIGYTNVDSSRSYDATSVGITYFFEKQQTLGPLDQFKYINSSTNVFGNYSHYDNSERFNGGGNLFINNFVIGGSYSYYDYDSGSSDHYNARVGYLISEDLIVNAYANKSKGFDTDYHFSLHIITN
ncbi:putative porin [Pseudoalteromonas sp. NBT06-2]|uniref:putative porin n=1 Tax=Pseudoalteromonas sp. NBT06-2 TaxID=2025950 RepID=UPI00148253D8|nr:putative porin [Pseudoalteromonas sp. NBT06-2]